MTDADALLILWLRPARIKARATAKVEALALLAELGARLASGGPLSERGGVFWISLPAIAVERAAQRLPLFGYTYAVDLAKPVTGRASAHNTVMWRKRMYELVRLYEEPDDVAREQAPDRRVFTLEARTGQVKQVRGYRGDSRPSKRRGVPAYDARMLVSIATGRGGGMLLDPFAGAGGLVIAAVARGCRVVSCDVDPSLRYGLKSQGAAHVVADARRLPFGAATFDALATEPPYEREAGETVASLMLEAARVLRKHGRLAMLCSAWQADALRRPGDLDLVLIHDEAIDRKGAECAVLLWEKL